MPLARIYRPPKSAMQSGRANTLVWVLEFVRQVKPAPDPLTGWPGSPDTSTQVRMRFATREAAEAYAKRTRIAYEVVPERPVHTRPKTYADNFR
jgi:NADH dehydrogenase ubiquinone Fe-S protein 4